MPHSVTAGRQSERYTLLQRVGTMKAACCLLQRVYKMKVARVSAGRPIESRTLLQQVGKANATLCYSGLEQRSYSSVTADWHHEGRALFLLQRVYKMKVALCVSAGRPI